MKKIDDANITASPIQFAYNPAQNPATIWCETAVIIDAITATLWSSGYAVRIKKQTDNTKNGPMIEGRQINTSSTG